MIEPVLDWLRRLNDPLRNTTQILSVNADWQLSRPFLVTGRYAAKWSEDNSNGLSTRYRAQVVGVRGTWEFTPKWDVGIVTSALLGGTGTSSRQYGVGLEVGYLLATNLWVSGGYNFFGYKDDDLSGNDYTVKGPYVRLRYKFDESILPRAMTGEAHAVPASATAAAAEPVKTSESHEETHAPSLFAPPPAPSGFTPLAPSSTAPSNGGGPL